jgi:uncharacterized protein (DUF433 family)
MQSLLDRITINPDQCGGRPCIRDMHIRVIDIVDLYAAGLTAAQILEEMPDLVPEDLQAALLYAARKLGNSNPTQLSPGVKAPILSEPALSKVWLTPEEDENWAHLQDNSSCPLCTQLSPVLTDSLHWRLALNRNQNLLGKSMLVLRRHLETVPDLTPAEWTDLHTQLRAATALLTRAFSPDHYN